MKRVGRSRYLQTVLRAAADRRSLLPLLALLLGGGGAAGESRCFCTQVLPKSRLF